MNITLAAELKFYFICRMFLPVFSFDMTMHLWKTEGSGGL